MGTEEKKKGVRKETVWGVGDRMAQGVGDRMAPLH